MASSGGGAFLPGDPPPSTSQALTSPTLTSPVLVNPTITGTVSGSPTYASGASFPFTVSLPTATGATGSAAFNVTTVAPQIIVATGASGAGINLPTGPVGAFHVINNAMTGVLNVYAVGSTINGTTGTTAAAITATGNKTALAFCQSAAVWQLRMNT